MPIIFAIGLLGDELQIFQNNAFQNVMSTLIATVLLVVFVAGATYLEYWWYLLLSK